MMSNADAREAKARFAIGVNTFSYTYSHGALDCLLHLKTLGYRTFEILATAPHFWPPMLDRATRRDMPKRLRDEGLSILSFNHPSLDHNLVSPMPEMRRYTVERFVEFIALAGEWGVPWVVVVPGKVSPLFPAPRPWLEDWFTAGIRALADAAKTVGVQLLIENVPTAWLPKAADVAAMLDALALPALGVCYDVANAAFIGEDPAAGVKRLGGRVKLVHLSDTGRDRWRHDPVGQGGVDFGAFAAALRDIGFTGTSMLEIISSTPDRDIAESHRRLAPLGWQAPAV